MENLKLLRIINDTVYYKNSQGEVKTQPLYTFPKHKIFGEFSIKDQSAIETHLMFDGFYVTTTKFGNRIIIPNQRQNYLFLFAAVFFLTILMSAFTSVRYIQMGDVNLYGNFLFFPLAFACTDVINELYGYPCTRSIIYTVAKLLLFIAGGLAITFNLSGTLGDGSSDHVFINLLAHIPKLLGIWAIALWCSDLLNAYVFDRMKRRLQGRSLWLRSMISSFIAHFVFSPLVIICEVIIGMLEIPAHQILELLYSGHLVKIAYAVCSLPIIYLAVYIVKQRENEYAVLMGIPIQDGHVATYHEYWQR